MSPSKLLSISSSSTSGRIFRRPRNFSAPISSWLPSFISRIISSFELWKSIGFSRFLSYLSDRSLTFETALRICSRSNSSCRREARSEKQEKSSRVYYNIKQTRIFSKVLPRLVPYVVSQHPSSLRRTNTKRLAISEALADKTTLPFLSNLCPPLVNFDARRQPGTKCCVSQSPGNTIVK